MKSLVFRDIPPKVEKFKDSDPGKVKLAGHNVAQAGIAQALLSHGTYDRYFFLRDTRATIVDARERLAQYNDRDRAEIIHFDDFPQPGAADQMVLFTSNETLPDLAHLRRVLVRPDIPCAGVVYSLSYSENITNALRMLLEDLYEYDALVCISHSGRRVIEGILQSHSDYITSRLGVSLPYRFRLPVIPLGIDTDLFRPRDKAEARLRLGIPDDYTVFLYLGRLSLADKMDPFPLVLTFCETLAKKSKKVMLIVAGDDTRFNLAPNLKALAGRCGAADQVRLLPNVPSEDKPWLYCAADVFVSPSDSVQETFGLTIPEAMASGLPVIASDWDGYSESIEHGKTGFLVPTSWAPSLDHVSSLAPLRSDRDNHFMLAQSVCVDLAALSHYMETLHENPQLRQEMGEAGRKRAVSKYAWSVVVSQYEQLWGELAHRSAGIKAEPRTSSRKGSVTSYNYLDVFRHYATGVLSGDATLRLTSRGRSFLRRELPIESLQINIADFRIDFDRQIISSCNLQPEIKIDALIEKMEKKLNASRELIAHHIVRLLKYGILETTFVSSVYRIERETP